MAANPKEELEKIIIVGNPNVGKSVLFNLLTGQHATVSNYPGTTVEILKGKAKIDGKSFEVIDTPGMYSLSPLSEEEAIARRIILDQTDALILHVVDAKNLERMIPLTLQLLESDLNVILVLNMMDEAKKLGLHFARASLGEKLNLPVVETVLTRGEGFPELKARILSAREEGSRRPSLNESRADENSKETIQSILDEIENCLKGNYGLSKRTIGMLLFEEDEEIWKLINRQESENTIQQLKAVVQSGKGKLLAPVEYEIAVSLRRRAEKITRLIVQEDKNLNHASGFWSRFGRWLDWSTTNPFTGLAILGFVLYWGFFQFVGVLGAGTVVDFLEEGVFVQYLNPFFTWAVQGVVPWPLLQDLFIGEYGVLTLGVRYAVSLILPIVAFYFFVFSIIEDSGYLPRLAMLVDRVFKLLGLSGRAVIPTVLGFGCVTMATMVTRTLPTKRERFIATLLLALAIPCSAQLGVILALLNQHFLGLIIWAGVIGFVFVGTGTLVNRMIPGDPASFYMELPPLRFPRISNVFFKTYMRVQWYLFEVIPLFIFASVMIWVGQVIGIFDLLIRWTETPVMLVGLPREAAFAFLIGFFRRDYGAAGLYDLAQSGQLDGVQLVVACVALTLFIPCIAQLLMNIKERGWVTGIAVSVFTVLFSFATAFILNFILRYFGVLL